MATQTKKPKWTVTNYAKIEKRRLELGFTKGEMAEALGVTNSTYHNWRRGTTVPHPNQQEKLKEAMDALVGRGGADEETEETEEPAGESRPTPRRAPARDTNVPHVHPERTRESGEHVLAAPVSMVPQGVPAGVLAQQFYPPADQSVPGIASITAAFIESQSNDVTPEAVYDFVRGLRKALSEKI